jgi:hypothetical protein
VLNPTVNFNQVNYIIHKNLHWINDYKFTWGDVQTAIWRCVMTPTSSHSSAPFTEANVQKILSESYNDGFCYVPEKDDDGFGVFLLPVALWPNRAQTLSNQCTLIKCNFKILRPPCSYRDWSTLYSCGKGQGFGCGPVLSNAGLTGDVDIKDPVATTVKFSNYLVNTGGWSLLNNGSSVIPVAGLYEVTYSLVLTLADTGATGATGGIGVISSVGVTSGSLTINTQQSIGKIIINAPLSAPITTTLTKANFFITLRIGDVLQLSILPVGNSAITVGKESYLTLRRVQT